jgi:hypothetical protein
MARRARVRVSNIIVFVLINNPSPTLVSMVSKFSWIIRYDGKLKHRTTRQAYWNDDRKYG